MARILSCIFRSPVVETIQVLHNSVDVWGLGCGWGRFISSAAAGALSNKSERKTKLDGTSKRERHEEAPIDSKPWSLPTAPGQNNSKASFLEWTTLDILEKKEKVLQKETAIEIEKAKDCTLAKNKRGMFLLPLPFMWESDFFITNSAFSSVWN